MGQNGGWMSEVKGFPVTIWSLFRPADGRQRALAAFALLAFVAAALFAGRGLASGAEGDVLRVRFGGDAERTRVVVDMVDSARGRVARDRGRGGPARAAAARGDQAREQEPTTRQRHGAGGVGDCTPPAGTSIPAAQTIPFSRTRR